MQKVLHYSWLLEQMQIFIHVNLFPVFYSVFY